MDRPPGETSGAVMAEDRQPDPADQPDDPSQDEPAPDQPASENPPPDQPAPYRLGGGSSSPPPDQPNNPVNPFEALLSSLSGGDMNALAAQLQSAFVTLGGAGAMFGGAPTDSGSGVNWEVTKDTARKTAASLGPDPTPDRAQQRAI